MRNVLCMTLLLLCVFQSLAQKPDWFIKLQKLQKFPSTEKDIEEFFNSPKITYSTPLEEIKQSRTKSKVVEYEIPEGELHVYYSAGKCSAENTEGSDLEDGVIISYYFTLRNLVPTSLLKIKRGTFPKVYKADDTEHWYYSNPDKGVTYIVLGEKLQYIRYTIPNVEKFDCEAILKKQK